MAQIRQMRDSIANQTIKLTINNLQQSLCPKKDKDRKKNSW